MKTLFIGPYSHYQELLRKSNREFVFCGHDPARIEGYNGKVLVLISGHVPQEMLNAVSRLLDATVEFIA